MTELSILKAFLNREVYTKYRNFVDPDFFGETKRILQIIDDWHATEDTDLSFEDLSNLFFARFLDKQEEFKGIFATLNAMNAPESVKTALEALKNKRMCEDLSVLAAEASAGFKSVSEVIDYLDKFEPEVKEFEFVQPDLRRILDSSFKTPGLRWRLKCLNQSLGSLRKGDFGFIFAYVNVGKTTFIADQAVYMAEQLSPEAGPILWFNNEQQGDVVQLRLFEACHGATTKELDSNSKKYQEEYLEKTKGKILVYDSPVITKQTIEAACKRYNPSLIIIDQLDKIQGFKADREDLLMGKIYQWARELAKRYGPVMAVCQATGDAEGESNLTMTHVANARVAKQAEADWILGIGKRLAPEFQRMRWLNIVKNKLLGDPDTDAKLRHSQHQVLLHQEKARYEDINE